MSTFASARDSACPLISVIMPVFNGALTLSRAIESVCQQAFVDWELLAIDDGSQDSSYSSLSEWCQRDDRIRVLRTPTNTGCAGARNLALRAARGDFIAYLDCDDEYYPHYLQAVAEHRSKGDILLFQFDWETDDPKGGTHVVTWDPAVYRDWMFTMNFIGTLAIAHLRELILRAGPFDERPWFQEDWELWKRLARTGADFVFLPIKSGVYHNVLKTSMTHLPRVTQPQRDHFKRNRDRGARLFAGKQAQSSRRKAEKIVFASPCSIIDPSSGAAIATNDALQLLARNGFRCQAFGTTRFDFREEICTQQLLAEMGLPYEVRTTMIGTEPATMVFARNQAVPVTLLRSRSTQAGPNGRERIAFLQAYEAFLAKNQPDAIVTYGANPTAMGIINLSRRRDIPIVFALKNLAYHDASVFFKVDYVFVPSAFSQRYYSRLLGLDCTVLPNVIDPQRVTVRDWRPQYLTFVNPQVAKGLFVFAGIAEQIARRRPDIPILIVNSRGRSTSLEQTGIDLSWARNLFGMNNTTDPKTFYRVTKLLVMPSVVPETFGLVAAEAMTNGIPVLASNRGALPETIGDSGVVLDIPAQYTPTSTIVPTREDVEPWIDTILRLWDDTDLYRRQCARAQHESQRWHPERLAPLFVKFFQDIHPQPGPPVAPNTIRSSGGVP